MSQRTLTWWESAYDTNMINANKWNFQISQSVAAGSAAAQSNVIWQSKALAPFTKISWKVQYALNWTAVLPGEGIEVSVYGRWQPCNKGQVFDINSDGFWTPSSQPGKDGWLSVGKVGYKYPDVPGIHIVVGILNATTGDYNPIFIDPAQLPVGSSSIYQPQETVTWFLLGGNRTGQVYTGSESPKISKDFSSPASSTGKFEWWTTFLFDSSTWAISENAPSAKQVAPFKSEVVVHKSPVEVELDPLGWLVTFKTAVAAELRSDLVEFLQHRLAQYFSGLEIAFSGADGSTLTVSYNSGNGAAGHNSIAAIGGLKGDSASAGSEEIIKGALDHALKSNKLEESEQWEITPDVDVIEDNPPALHEDA